MNVIKSKMHRRQAVTVWIVLFIVEFLAASCLAIVQYRISEEIPTGTVLGRISQDADLPRFYSSAELPELRYSFLAQPATTSEHYFSIDASTSVVTTAKRLDRDVMCAGLTTCQLSLDVAVGPARHFRSIPVQVELVDINDNSPEFPTSEIECKIPESSAVGASFLLKTAAHDVDNAPYGVSQYHLVGGGALFRLEVNHDAEGATELSLVVMSELDREQNDFYSMNVIAQDGGSPPLNGSVSINVTIIDANDNLPVFEQESYHVSVYENASVDSEIITVRATDKDSSDNGLVTYTFSSNTLRKYAKLFTIDMHTGQILLKRPLDYELESEYRLLVIAEDNGPNSRPVTCVINVIVLDINDNAPSVSINTLTPSGRAVVSENASIGVFVAHVSVVDGDAGDSGNVSCRIASGNESFRLRRLHPTQYAIITSAQLDRETQDVYWVSVTCHDSGVPSLVTVASVTVTVTDANDNAPVFSLASYHVSVAEDTPLHVPLFKVTATDADIGSNADIRYSTDAPVFRIHPTSGEISAIVQLDYELNHSMMFVVIASDSGDVPMTASVNVTVTILDVNDEAPRFLRESYSFGVFEGQPSGSSVGTVYTSDADESPFDTVDYTLRSATADDAETISSFSIDPISGRLITSTSLDREHRSVYKLIAVAANHEPPFLSSVVSVAVYVLDANDNAPQFEFPPPRGGASVRTSPTLAPGAVITRVRAHDLDIGHNAQLTFTLVDGAGIFRMDAGTGALTLHAAAPHSGSEYNLTVVATDGGIPSMNATASLRIIFDSDVSSSATARKSTEHRLTSSNLLTVVIVASISLVIIVGLIIAIIIIRLLGDRRYSNGCQDNKQTVDASQNMLHDVSDVDSVSSTMMTKDDEDPRSDDMQAKRSVLRSSLGKRSFRSGYRDRTPAHQSAMELSTWLGNGVANKEANKTTRYHHPPPTQGKNPGVPNATQQKSLEQLKHLPWLGPEQIIEVHRLLEYLGRDTDVESACSSGEISNADSGNGESEEGATRIDIADVEQSQTTQPAMCDKRHPPSYETFCAQQNGHLLLAGQASVNVHDETSSAETATTKHSRHQSQDAAATVEIVQPSVNASFRQNRSRTEPADRQNIDETSDKVRHDCVSVRDSIEDVAEDSDGASSTSGSYTPDRNDDDDDDDGGAGFSVVTDSAV